ncbi:polymorphic toxin-type HINT domain-containing protein [Streptomyces sp. NPDC002039]|uniref:polymorphic toxin-type HINT domain-containing protein n=1 Tax=Streptomyces sp. NPDC002039 TaxID=3154660 RepID=UPI00331E011C
MNAADLKTGDRLRTPEGELKERIGLRAWIERMRVHNLTVDDLHTYHVLAGRTAVLVHNAGGYTPPPSDKKVPGFPEAKYVGKGSPKSGGGYRDR